MNTIDMQLTISETRYMNDGTVAISTKLCGTMECYYRLFHAKVRIFHVAML